jgi:hypothetical protein
VKPTGEPEGRRPEKPAEARRALGIVQDRAAWVLTRMVEGHEPADMGRVAACRAVLELGEPDGRR